MTDSKFDDSSDETAGPGVAMINPNSGKLSLKGDVVATVTPVKGKAKSLVYPLNTSSGTLVQDSTSYVGVTLAPDVIEEMTESVERSRGLIAGGLKFSLTAPKSLGGWGISFERKPAKETKTTRKTIYRPKKG